VISHLASARVLEGVHTVDSVQRLWIAAPGSYCCLHEPEEWKRYTVDYGFDMPPPSSACICSAPEFMVAVTTGCDGRCDPTSGAFKHAANCVGPLLELRVACDYESSHVVPGDHGNDRSVFGQSVCPKCNGLQGGTVSAGVWRVPEGGQPLRIVDRSNSADAPNEVSIDTIGQHVRIWRPCAWFPGTFSSSLLDLSHLVAEGSEPTSLVGWWALLIERTPQA
jgi:hypothetical protein